MCRRLDLPRSKWKTGACGIQPSTTGARKASRLKNGPDQSSRWGARPEFEMEQVLPGADPDDPFSDPIIESNDRKDGGDIEGANKILMNLCQTDLRWLDAHAHLGNIAFDHW